MRSHDLVYRCAPIEHRQKMACTDRSALLDDGPCDFLGGAGDEFVFTELEPAGRPWGVRHVCSQAFVLRHKALQAIRHSLSIQDSLVKGRRHGYPPAKRKVLRARMKTDGLGFFAVRIEDELYHRRRIEARADLDAAPSGATRRVCAHDGRPSRGRWLLQRPWQQPKIAKREIFAAMGNHTIGEGGVYNGEDLLMSLAGFGHGYLQTRKLLRHANGSADFQASSGYVIEHADFLDNPHWMVVGQDDTHDAEAKSRRPRRERSDQEVRRGRVGPAKMVLAEEYSLEVKCFVTDP